MSLKSIPKPFVFDKEREDVSLRGENYRGYRTGKKVVMDFLPEPLHYKEVYDSDHPWVDIDEKSKIDKGNFWFYDKMPNKVSIAKDGSWYEVEERKTGQKIKVELQSALAGLELFPVVTQKKVAMWQRSDKARELVWKVTESGKGNSFFKDEPEAVKNIGQSKLSDLGSGIDDLEQVKVKVAKNGAGKGAFLWSVEIAEDVLVDPTVETLTGTQFNWPIPQGVSKFNWIRLWGGGGAGGGSDSNDYGAGGGGGAFCQINNVEPPSTEHRAWVTVAALRMGTVGGNGSSGNFSRFAWKNSGSVVAQANGGSGGLKGGASGGAGATSAGYGDVNYTGGNGAPARIFDSGGGGGGAGTTGNGGNASARTGGTGTADGGGNGGDGVDANVHGGGGSFCGGAGGGGGKGGTNRRGGSGARGEIQIEYDSVVGVFEKLTVSGTDEALRRTDTGDTFATTFTAHRVGYESTVYKKCGVGMRFRDVIIPKGSNITSAYIIIEAANAQSGTTMRTRFYGEDDDDADTFSNAGDFDGRIRTSAVEWDEIGAWASGETHKSVDIRDIIQIIVNRAGWESGNALVLFWDDFDRRGDDVIRYFYTAEQGVGDRGPRLVIFYSDPVEVTRRRAAFMKFF